MEEKDNKTFLETHNPNTCNKGCCSPLTEEVMESSHGCCRMKTGGGCGMNEKCCGAKTAPEILRGLSYAEAGLLEELAQSPFLPAVFYDSFEPIYINSDMTSQKEIFTTGEALFKLTSLGIITLDSDIPLANYDYGLIVDSELFRAHFIDLENKPLHKGSFALTLFGQELLDTIE